MSASTRRLPEAVQPLSAKPFGIERGSPYPPPLPTEARRRKAMGHSEYDPGFNDRRPWNAGVRSRAIVIQQKTRRPVQFELLEPARGSILAWLERRGGAVEDFVFPSRIDHADHISTRQYARLVDEWVSGIGLRPEDYGTHSLRRIKASIF